MSVWKPIQNPACCLYCKEEFIIKGKQRWHNCPQAHKAKRLIEKIKSKEWQKKTEYSKTRRSVHIGKENWKKCIKCGALTPNRFGRCGNCLDEMSRRFDLDFIIDFDSGNTKTKGRFYNHEEPTY